MIHATAMGLFGFALGALVCYLGGLMAVDICPKRATGAAMGVIGLFSYLGSTVQEFVNGWLIETTKTVVDGKTINVYHFDDAPYFWIAAAILSFLVTATVWKVREQE
jgi:OPA family sugar phosphate sensor protein UhpC-like MFS transporter